MYHVTVQYKLQATFLIEGTSEDDAKNNIVLHLQSKYARHPNASRKIKSTYKNVVATGATIAKAPFYSVTFTADAVQCCHVYAENDEVAKTEAERQITHAHRTRPNQKAFATEIEALDASKVKQH